MCQDTIDCHIYVASNWEPILFLTIGISPESIMGPRKTNVISTNRFKGLIPAIFHNLRGCDSRVIMQGLTKVLSFYEKQLGMYCRKLSKKEI